MNGDLNKGLLQQDSPGGFSRQVTPQFQQQVTPEQCQCRVNTEVPTTSWFICTLMLTSNMLGTSPLTAPSVLAEFGVPLALLMLIAAALLSVAGLLCLAVVSSSASSFLDAARKAGLGWGAGVFDIIVFIDSFISLIALTVLAGDVATPLLFVETTLQARTFTIVSVAILVFAPLSLVKFLNTLRSLAKIAMFALLYILLLALVLSFKNPSAPPESVFTAFPSNPQPLTLMSSFTLLFTIFTCHLNLFTVSNELENHSGQRVMSAALTATSIALMIVGALAVAVLCFTWPVSSLPTDVITKFPGNAWGNIARVGYAFVVTARFPLYAHPCRRSLFLLCRISEEQSDDRYANLRVVTTLILISLSTLLAEHVRNFGLVIGLIGALCKFSLACVASPLLFLRITSASQDMCDKPYSPQWQRVGAVILFTIGVLATPISAVSVIIRFGLSSRAEH